jgi:hypothetical protein
LGIELYHHPRIEIFQITPSSPHQTLPISLFPFLTSHLSFQESVQNYEKLVNPIKDDIVIWQHKVPVPQLRKTLLSTMTWH